MPHTMSGWAARTRIRNLARTTASPLLSVETHVGRRLDPQPSGCWHWTGPRDRRGYGICSSGHVHRFVYETMVGPIPDGWHVHHRCFNPRCANPDHLTVMSSSQHARLHGAIRSAQPRKPRKQPKDIRVPCIDCGNPCKKTRCRACHEAWVATLTA